MAGWLDANEHHQRRSRDKDKVKETEALMMIIMFVAESVNALQGVPTYLRKLIDSYRRSLLSDREEEPQYC